MFYRGTEVGCCAIMHEERKRGSKEASSKGNKQNKRVCVCQKLCSTKVGEEPTDTHTFQQTSHTHAANGDLVATLTKLTNALSIVCVFMHAREGLCQGADQSRHGPQ